MPRANDGSVTLVVGNPVVNGTAISADVHNATMADLAAMIEDSLSRTGKGGMASPIKFANGTESLPSITFTDDTDTGIFRFGENVMGFSAGGNQILGISDAGATLDGNLVLNGDFTVSGAVSFTTVLDKSNLPAVDEQVSTSDSSNWDTTSATPTDVPNATVTITTTGRPVWVFAQGALDASDARLYVGPNGAATPTFVRAHFRIKRTGTSSANFDVNLAAGGAAANSVSVEVPPSVIQYLDVVTEGTYTYQLQAWCETANTVLAAEYVKLVAIEL